MCTCKDGSQIGNALCDILEKEEQLAQCVLLGVDSAHAEVRMFMTLSPACLLSQ